MAPSSTPFIPAGAQYGVIGYNKGHLAFKYTSNKSYRSFTGYKSYYLTFKKCKSFAFGLDGCYLYDIKSLRMWMRYMIVRIPSSISHARGGRAGEEQLGLSTLIASLLDLGSSILQHELFRSCRCVFERCLHGLVLFCCSPRLRGFKVSLVL